MTDKLIRYIFIQVANAIHQLHKGGVAHRDIKPENIILTRDYEVKIIDFGFSQALSGKKEQGFMTTKLGTPMYMAPEIHDRTIKYQG